MARSERFTTPALDGVTLHAIQHGDPARPKLVLLHGGGANAHWWDDVAPALAIAGRNRPARVIGEVIDDPMRHVHIEPLGLVGTLKTRFKKR